MNKQTPEWYCPTPEIKNKAIMKKQTILSGFLIILLPVITFALDSLNVRCIGSWPYSVARRVVATDTIVYLSVGGGLLIFNTSDPSQPIKVSECPLSANIRDMAKSNQYLYTAHRGGGLSIIDVSNPLFPIRLSYYNLTTTYAVAIDSNFAYLIGDDSLYILDITNPCRPTQISSTPITSNDGWNVFVYHSRAYVCQFYRGFTIYDISNPYSPTLLGEYLTTNYPGVYDIWVRDSLAYVAVNDSLRILSIANPQHIYQIGSWGRYSSYEINEIYIKDSIMCLAYDFDGVYIINIANPQQPFYCSSIHFRHDRDIEVSDTLAFVATFDGIGIINIANPHQPSIVSYWNNCPGWVHAITITDNNHAVLACLNGVWIINNSNLNMPRLRSFLKYPKKYAFGLAANDSLIYTSMFDSLRIINIANPDTPQVIGRLRTSWSRTLSYRDNVLYQCSVNTPDGFYTIDVSNPASPTVLGYIPFPSDAYGMFVKGNYAYVGDGGYMPPPYGEDGGFRIFNITNPNNPFQVSQYIPNAEGYMMGVYVVGDTAFVCDDENGIFIFDVSNPSNPILLTIYPNSRPSDIIVRGNLAFLADGYFGIRILDISNLQSIQEVGYYNREGYADKIKVIDNLIYVTFADGGYVIFEYYGAGLEEGPSQNNVARKPYLTVLPLPSKSAFLIKYNIIKQNKVALDILDPMGRIKRVIKNEAMKVGDYQQNLDVSDLPAGVYFIRLKQESDQIVKKITIVR